MRTNLINIRNSKGVRLPKAVIERAGLTSELEIEVSAGAVVIRSAGQPCRRDWASAAAACHRAGDDQLDDWDATIGDFEGAWS